MSQDHGSTPCTSTNYKKYLTHTKKDYKMIPMLTVYGDVIRAVFKFFLVLLAVIAIGGVSTIGCIRYLGY